MNWLILTLALQVGTFTGTNNIDSTFWNSQNYTNYLQIVPEMQFANIVKIKGYMKTYQSFAIENPGHYFTPYMIDYNFDISVYYKGFSIGYKHEKTSPFISDISLIQKNIYESKSNELYLRYELKIISF